MTELYLNGILVVLEPKTIITQTRQNNDLAKGVASRQVSYTNQFKFPMEPNLELMENLGLIGHQSTKPYVKMVARLVENGIEYFNDGIAKVTKTKGKFYEVQVTFESELFDDLSKKMMKDIPTASIWPDGVEDLEIQGLSDVTGVWEDPDNHAFTFPYYEVVEISKMVPFWKEKELFEAILTASGITYNAPFLSSEDIGDLLISPDIDQDYTYPVEIENGTDDFDLNESPSWSGGIGTHTTLVYDETGTPSKTAILKATATLNRTSSGTTTEEFFILSVENGGVQIDSQAMAINGTTEIKLRVPLLDDLEIKMTYNVVGSFTLYNIDYDLTYNLYELQGEKTFNLPSILPDMTQMDFVREIMFRYGLSVFPIDGVYEFKQIKDILTDRSNAQDWSDNFIELVEESYLPSGYGQENTAKYANDDDIGNTASLDLANEHLEAESSLFESTYEYYDETIPKFYEEELNDNSKLEKINSESYPITLVKAQYDISSLGLTFLKNTEADIDEATTYNASAGEEIPRIKEPIESKFSTVLTNQYNELRQLMCSFDEKAIRIYMNPIAFRDIDLSRLVYFRQLGSYFYVNKVENYKGSFATVRALKIPNDLM